MEQNLPTRQPGISAALAAVRAQAPVSAPTYVPGEDAGRSLAEMAQRDLDAALQLLADRAQYITGASGVAIALRREGRDGMLCRASSGTNAPELGALLSTEFGLSGESVRTRQLMRCDDAERDARVNREVCKQMGIASVLVMPVVNDDQVLGVFELFSGKAHAFGERDLSAVQRLSEMVETAVRTARVTENLPEHLSARESSVAEAVHPEVFEGQFLTDLVVEEAKEHRGQPVRPATASASESTANETTGTAEKSPAAGPSQTMGNPANESMQVPEVPAPVPVTKPLFWSATQGPETGRSTPAEADQSHVPPMLRGLRKCEACGFPVSAERMLCVECEEKKWRGQLRPQSGKRNPSAGVATVPPEKPDSPMFSAAAPSMAKSSSASSANAAEAIAMGPKDSVSTAAIDAEKLRRAAGAAREPAVGVETASAAASPEFVLSAGIEPSRSWFSANKYILLMLLMIAVAVTAFLFFR